MNELPELRRILEESRTLAVVGLSADPFRPSYGVSRYMQEQGFRIVPVNPKYTAILGEPCYPDLRAVPDRVDIVNVFRRSEDCEEIARDAVAIGASCLWLQLGVVNDEARRIAEAGGLAVVMDRCIKIEHARLGAD